MKCKKIFVVEDDYRLRQITKRALESSGFVVETVANGKEALDYLALHPAPGLMLLDLMMPVMTGTALLDKLKEQGRLGEFPIVVLSAVANVEAKDVYGLPAVAKPVSLQALVNLGEQYCNAVELPNDESSEPAKANVCRS